MLFTNSIKWAPEIGHKYTVASIPVPDYLLKEGYEPSDKLKKEIQVFVKKKLSSAAYPREIDFLETIPKTRSGKIMRRLLKARELGLPEGDTSTLED